MKTRIPKNRSTIAYTETAEDYTLAFDMFSYLVFCQREQIEMAAFYNNLLHTADTRTILQATVNNIQYGVEDAHTLMALRQIYKILAKKLDVREPFKNVLADFVRQGGGVPPNSVKEKNLLWDEKM